MPKFNLMSYIMPPEDKMFFTYFQESAEICLKTAKLYDEIMHNHLNDEYKEKALKYKRKGKLSYKACLKQLNKSFITPIEREDIQTIAVQLNKITKKGLFEFGSVQIRQLHGRNERTGFNFGSGNGKTR